MTEWNFQSYLERIAEVGFVEEVRQSLVFASGLPGARARELVVFESGTLGQVTTLHRQNLGIVILSPEPPPIGTRIARTDSFLELPVGSGLLGRVVNSVCQPLDQRGIIAESGVKRPLEAPAPGIKVRRRINRPLETGVSIVDILVPLGKGQRELVIGDRKTGKTSFLLQALLTQARANSVCIYAAIGMKMADIKAIEEYVNSQKVAFNVVIVASSSSDPVGLIFLTPYTAMTLAEYFKDQGRDCLVVLDDLTTHAKAYREISLFAGKFPGRESYPGDIFYTHSRLLERAGNFTADSGEVSISVLPVAESLEGDISGYIQTNLMSQCDGHIFFDSDLFVKGRRPAVNPFLSVSRVGHQTQSKTRRDMSREIQVVLSLYEKASELAHFGSALLETIKLSLAIGEKVLFFFDQEAKQLLPSNVQTLIFALLWGNFWTQETRDKIKQDISKIVSLYQSASSFKAYCDKLVQESGSFNNLLGTLAGQQKSFRESYLR